MLFKKWDKSGNKKFEACYNQYKNYMYKIAYDKMKDVQLAEDAVHEAFVKLLDAFSKVEDAGSEKTKNLIKIITKNVCIDMLRRENKMQETIPFENSYEEIYNNGTSDGLHDITQCIDSLPEIYSSVLVLKYIYGYTSKEIAAMLSLKEGTVRSRISRGKDLLERKLKENGIDI